MFLKVDVIGWLRCLPATASCKSCILARPPSLILFLIHPHFTLHATTDASLTLDPGSWILDPGTTKRQWPAPADIVRCISNIHTSYQRTLILPLRHLTGQHFDITKSKGVSFGQIARYFHFHALRRLVPPSHLSTVQSPRINCLLRRLKGFSSPWGPCQKTRPTDKLGC